MQTEQRVRRAPRTFSSKVIISNALADDNGVQKLSKAVALSIVANLPSKKACQRSNNICKYGLDTTDKMDVNTPGLLQMNNLLLSGNMFFEFHWQTGKCYLYGLNSDRGANQVLCCSVEHAAMICDVVLPLLRTAGWARPSAVRPACMYAMRYAMKTCYEDNVNHRCMAGFPMSQPVVNRTGMEAAAAMWTARGYFIDDGTCQWAAEGENVACIVADEKTVICSLHDAFMREIGAQLGYERHRCYLAAEVNSPLLGWILKSQNTDPNDVLPFFHKWGIPITWSKTSWLN